MLDRGYAYFSEVRAGEVRRIRLLLGTWVNKFFSRWEFFATFYALEAHLSRIYGVILFANSC